ncbi:multiple epidermal growth factor-like domains protein 10 [Saccostrea cucullata]|uniref:multiple epidermal growth factor-like domains protein 10 n=1 Tax=Saccostrea cuccullata TaxID=36930 RepID=UPI002ED01255
MAVDGNPATCARPDVIGPNSRYQRAQWYVDLGDMGSIYSIKIQFEDMGETYVMRQRGRYAGFSLYLSNSTTKEEGYMCYKDGPDLPPLNFTTKCVGYGRFVIYYNERLSGVKYPEGYEEMSYSQLCEVIVEGCSSGKYGENCKMNCSPNCFGTLCDIIDGKCMKCRPGWEGEKCQSSCLKESYGQDCKFRCSGHCKDGQSCDHVTGECVKGCVLGWTGSMCNKTCDNGHYGINCSSKCSGHCLYDKACNKETGHCDSGCSDGFLGDLCQNECTPGWFGEGCKESCSGHCADKAICNHVDGICRNGCEDGYTGQKCSTICPLKHYGRNCSSLCSSKCLGTCKHTDGSCTCSPGWMKPPNCNTKCLHDKYGENCSNVCSSNCVNGTCDRFNGSCTEGCKEPYYGEMCNQSE